MKFNTLSLDFVNRLQKDFSSFLNFDSIQCYIPIFDHYMEVVNKLCHNVLKNKYIIKNILAMDDIEQDGDAKKDSYIKSFITANVVNQYNDTELEREIFIKFSPIVDVVHYVLNEYNIEHDARLPNLHQRLLNDKINNFSERINIIKY